MSVERVKIVLTEADDPRLAGWVQCTVLEVPPATRVKVDVVVENELAKLYGADGARLAVPTLTVRVSASDDGGPFEPWTFVFFERPLANDLRTLDGLAGFFEGELDGEPLPSRFDREAVWGGSWPKFEPISAQVIFDQLIALRVFLAEEGEGMKRVAAMVDNAYALGRAVRQEELAGRLGRGDAVVEAAAKARADGTATQAAKAAAWMARALPVARKVRGDNPEYSQEDVAQEIRASLGLSIKAQLKPCGPMVTVNLPKIGGLKTVIAGWEKEWRSSSGEKGLKPRASRLSPET